MAPETPVTATDLINSYCHNSPAMATDPTEDRFVAMANRMDNPDFGCALQVSGDGGRGWVPARPVPELPPGAEKCYAPELAFDADGTLYYLFVGLAGAGNAPMGVFLTTSTDRARTFSPPRMVVGPNSFMVRMAIDQDLGRVHLVWLQAATAPPIGGLPPTPNPIVAAHSDDGGVTFSPPVPVSDGDRPRAVAPALALGPDGSVHVAYYDLVDDARDYQGLAGPTWDGTWSVVVASSSDGGGSFGPGVVVDDAVAPPGRVMLILTMPPPALVAGGAGRLVTAWPDARLGDPDVLLSRSSDAGRSWAAPLRLNDDPPGNGRDQSLPRLSLAPDGRLDAIFYDRRHDPENLRQHVSYTSSTDGGERFTPNLQLTTESSDSRIGQRYLIESAEGLSDFGSRLALLSRPSSALAAWADTRNARLGTPIQHLFSTTVALPVVDDESSPVSRWPLAAAVGAAVVLVLVAVGRARRRGSRTSS